MHIKTHRVARLASCAVLPLVVAGALLSDVADACKRPPEWYLGPALHAEVAFDGDILFTGVLTAPPPWDRRRVPVAEAVVVHASRVWRGTLPALVAVRANLRRLGTCGPFPFPYGQVLGVVDASVPVELAAPLAHAQAPDLWARPLIDLERDPTVVPKDPTVVPYDNPTRPLGRPQVARPAWNGATLLHGYAVLVLLGAWHADPHLLTQRDDEAMTALFLAIYQGEPWPFLGKVDTAQIHGGLDVWTAYAERPYPESDPRAPPFVEPDLARLLQDTMAERFLAHDAAMTPVVQQAVALYLDAAVQAGLR